MSQPQPQQQSNTDSQQAALKMLSIKLTGALAMENAGLQRMQRRSNQIQDQNAKQKLEEHIETTQEQINQLSDAIRKLGGSPNSSEAAQLPTIQPTASFTQMSAQHMGQGDSEQLLAAENDVVSEHAEVTCYQGILHLIQSINLQSIMPELANLSGTIQNIIKQEEGFIGVVRDNLNNIINAIIKNLNPQPQPQPQQPPAGTQ